MYDLLVVGAGPAGLMSAASAKGLKVLVLEHNEKCGKKLYITGKGRCNITNDTTADGFLKSVVSNPKFLYSAINQFSPTDTIEFFEQNGLKLVVERGGRVFPLSNKASDVTNALLKFVSKNNVKILLQQHIKNIVKVGNGGDYNCSGHFVVSTDTLDYSARFVVLATGGVSYPLTGSDGSGYQLAKMLGHNIVLPKPALVPIEFEQDVCLLQGLSLRNINITVMYNGKVLHSFFGEMVFTDKGASGPIILSTSSIINRLDLGKVKLYFDLKPALTVDQLDQRILRDWQQQKNKIFANSLFELLPKTLIPYIVKLSKIDPNCRVNSIKRQDRLNLILTIKNLEFTPSKLGDIEFGIVTAGGVDTKEIDPKTMQSKLVKGLFFAGEIIDLDAFTGGYNLQIAFSTGHLAGSSLSKIANYTNL